MNPKNKNLNWFFIFLFLFLTIGLVNAYDVNITFYDESTLSVIPEVTITDANTSVYTSDVNGLWQTQLTGAKDLTISKTGYGLRKLQFNFTEDANYNFLLNPTGLDSSIGFIVKDTNNNLWTNKYLMFFKKDFNITEMVGDTNADEVNSDATSYTLFKTFDYTGKLYYPLISKVTNIIWRNISSGTAYVMVRYTYNDDTNLEVENTCISSHNEQKTYTNTNANKPVKKIEVLLKTSSNKTYENNTRVYFTGYNFYNNTIINSLLTSSSGTATANISSTGDYNALLYTADGNLTHTYTKTNVTVNKPKEEINPSNSVSPYDITVNGLLEYSLTNQTASSVDISIFAGAVGNYIFTVADYNANPLDRQYLERSYIAKAPMGSDYVSSILYQPYLIGVTDVIVPRIYVLDQLTRTIQDAEIYISTNINFTETIVESGLTDGAGVFMFSAIPLKNYYVSVYYEGVFKGTYLIKPRTSDDVFFITVDRTAHVDISQTLMINIDFTDTVKQQSYDENLSIKAEITSNYDYLTGYNLKVYQGNTLKYDANFSGSGSSITIDKEVDMNLFQKFQDVRAVVTAKYTIGGVAGTQSASQRISIFASNNRFTYFTKMREEVGQPLAILLSIILTAMVVAIITFSGLPISPAVTGVLGILVLGIFAFMGWLDLGVIAFGVDIGKILYILLVGVALYFTIRIGGV